MAEQDRARLPLEVNLTVQEFDGRTARKWQVHLPFACRWRGETAPMG